MLGALLGPALASAGCPSTPKSGEGDHPKGDHPTSEADHPKGDHPEGDHPKGEPTSRPKRD